MNPGAALAPLVALTERMPRTGHEPLMVVALIPAHNEQNCIASAVESLLAQHRRPDRIVVICDNCTDNTFGVVSQYPVIAVQSEGNRHGKSGALNFGWKRYAQDADIVVCIDADTVLPPGAVGGWMRELLPGVGGISAQVVMTGDGFLERVQRSEFCKSAQIGLRRGYVSVISGTGCCYSGPALRTVAERAPERAPWSHSSITEDFYLTYQLRRAGWRTIMSSSVKAHTGAMSTLRSLWHQRVKWHVGTIQDLLSFGVNKLTLRDWLRQVNGLTLIIFWLLYLTLLALCGYIGELHFTWIGLAIPVFFSVAEAWQARLVHGRSWKDIVLAASLLPTYFYAGLTVALLISSWLRILVRQVSAHVLWDAQYRAEQKAVRP